MIQLTEAQQVTIKKMAHHHFVTQFATGAVVVVFKQLYQNANVVDVDGKAFSLSRYLAIIDRHQ